MKRPFTEGEREVSDLLVDAHNAFIKLERTHATEIQEWVLSLHRLQDLLGARVLRREFPETFQ